MLSTIRFLAILLPLIACVSVASAQERAPAPEPGTNPDRCTGTFCDLYYNTFGKGAAQQQPAAPQTAPRPAVAARAPAAAAPPASDLTPPNPEAQGSGGLIAIAKGAPDRGCTGTLCDLLYGAQPERPEGPPPAGATVPESATANAPSRNERVERDDDERPEPREKPRCAAAQHDPWSCYR